MGDPFWRPGLNRRQARKIIRPSPQPADDGETITVPMPHLRGTGQLAPEALAERAREQHAREHVEQVRERIRPRLMNSHQVIRAASRALVSAGFSDDATCAGILGILATMRDADRPMIHVLIMEIRTARAELESSAGPHPEDDAPLSA